jgi:AcrR family transcriptional regulator
MQDVAERLQISKPTLYQHAQSKGDILVAIIDAFTAEATRRLDEALGDAEDVRWVHRLIGTWIDLSIDMRPHLQVWDGEQRELADDDRARFRRWSRDVEQRVRAAVHASQQAGQMRSDIPAGIVTFALLSLTNWTARWLQPGGEFDPGLVADMYGSIVLAGVTDGT